LAKYWVETIHRGIVATASTIDAPTPVKAAIKVAGGEVTFRTSQVRWIKVTPVGGQQSFEFVRA
jgi:hypothetical protein